MSASDHLNPDQFFHGTSAQFKPGDMLTAKGANEYGRNSRDSRTTVSFTSQPWNAAGYAESGWHEREGSHVYEVKPVGKVTSEAEMDLGDPYPEYNYRAPRARVVREIPYEEAKGWYK